MAEPPPERTIRLGPLRGWYGDYDGLRVCEVPAAHVAGDISSVNALLAQFLDSTSAGPEGSWSNEQLALLREGPKLLPPVISAHQQLLEQARHCDFPPELGMDDALRVGAELTRQARNRLHDAPTLLPRIQAYAQLRGWKEEELRQRATARELVCHSRRSVRAIYYAVVDEHGQREWLFCDGVRVVQTGAAGARSVLTADGAAVIVPRPYLASVSRFPAARLRHAPGPVR